MARGDLVIFDEYPFDLGKAVHNLSTATLKFGIVDDTITPTAGDATPRWGDYSANEVSTGGGYTANGVTLSGVTWSEVGGVSTLDDSGNISLAENASGFEDGYWGIVYDDSATNDEAIGYVDLGGPVSEVAGPVSATWNANGIHRVTA